MSLSLSCRRDRPRRNAFGLRSLASNAHRCRTSSFAGRRAHSSEPAWLMPRGTLTLPCMNWRQWTCGWTDPPGRRRPCQRGHVCAQRGRHATRAAHSRVASRSVEGSAQQVTETTAGLRARSRMTECNDERCGAASLEAASARQRLDYARCGRVDVRTNADLLAPNQHRA